MIAMAPLCLHFFDIPMSQHFAFHIRSSVTGIARERSFAQCFQVEDSAQESWVIVNPHDDDGILGMGLLILAARDAGIRVTALVVSDGRMGYRSEEHRKTITEVRKHETLTGYAILGVAEEDVIFLDYPDCDLHKHRGRREAGDNPNPIAGYSGLLNSITFWLRARRTTQIFIPTGADIHPDHKVVYEQGLMSNFFSPSRMWPELGEPLPKMPIFREMQLYSMPAGEPDIQVLAPPNVFEQKMQAAQSFPSQGAIHGAIEKLRREGPVEYFWTRDHSLVDRTQYAGLFE